ncbi:hypothetical protein HMPREF0083_05676 [Aneurinibacillus aneurinilyticus ATCC 12856]|uniref:Uncharacterized protein n=1 Tax=Aneurinibacillus aneurinilyticus ATCC 12856 TaxID=649747 RepID=U1WAC2_ANEAE|nr:hypothetical protein HMPREF0083_05676 [Aneurinibacillus aneurinilyticus ATCC 12856]
MDNQQACLYTSDLIIGEAALLQACESCFFYFLISMLYTTT